MRLSNSGTDTCSSSPYRFLIVYRRFFKLLIIASAHRTESSAKSSVAPDLGPCHQLARDQFIPILRFVQYGAFRSELVAGSYANYEPGKHFPYCLINMLEGNSLDLLFRNQITRLSLKAVLTFRIVDPPPRRHHLTMCRFLQSWLGNRDRHQSRCN